jgi:glycosyltransferase involved in cell wall biosynthesis
LTIVTLTLDLGGTERHIAQISPRLAAEGFDVTVACLGRKGEQAAGVMRQGVRVIGPSATGFGTSHWKSAQALAAGLAMLSKDLALHRPDIAHFFLPLPYLAGSALARLCRVPHLVMSRRSQNDYQRKRPGLAAREHRLHRQMDLILANSRRVYDELLGEGADPTHTGLIYNGLDLAAYRQAIDRRAARERLAIPDDAVVMAIVANLIAYKGHADLIAALGQAKDRLPPDWRLLVIGRDDGIGAALQTQCSALGIGEHVRWLGARADVPDLLRLSDIGLNVSHEEGFSNAVIEGMAAGLPMLVSDVGGNAEAVGEGIGGVVVPPRTPSAIAAALPSLAGDSALRARMGRAARDRAAQLFGLDACVERYRTAYRAVLDGSALPPSIDPRQTRLAPRPGTG